MNLSIQELRRFIQLISEALKKGWKFKQTGPTTFRFDMSTRHLFLRLDITVEQNCTTFSVYGVGDTYLYGINTLDPRLDDHQEMVSALSELAFDAKNSVYASGGVLFEDFNKALTELVTHYRPPVKGL
jgi:hypothetical protein